MCQVAEEEFECTTASPRNDTILTIVYEHTVDSLRINMIWMLPKYISCFCNSQIDGTLYLGIGDDCEITGEPLVPGLTEDVVRQYMVECVTKFVTAHPLSAWDDFMEIQIIRVENGVENLHSEDFVKTLQLQQKATMEYNDAMLAYNVERQSWMQRQMLHSSKLIDIVNTTYTRKQLISFMYANRGDWVEGTSQLVEALQRDTFLHFNTNYEYFEAEKANRGKIWYWVTQYKEGVMASLASQKPDRPATLATTFASSMHISRLRDLRKHCVVNGIPFGVIAFRIKGDIAATNGVGFRFPNDDVQHCRTMKRVEGKCHGPYSVSMSSVS